MQNSSRSVFIFECCAEETLGDNAQRNSLSALLLATCISARVLSCTRLRFPLADDGGTIGIFGKPPIHEGKNRRGGRPIRAQNGGRASLCG